MMNDNEIRDEELNEVAGGKGSKQKIIEYTVVKGDTLWALSRKYKTTIQAIMDLNKGKIVKPELIVTGWVIKIPDNR